MVIALVDTSLLWLNAFPSKGGLSNVSPRELTTGIQLDHNTHCKLAFGTYVQTHEDSQRNNTPKARTIGAIALGPNMSSLSGYWFTSLSTGKIIHRRRWIPLPMPTEVIHRVEHLGILDHQPNLLSFCNSFVQPET